MMDFKKCVLGVAPTRRDCFPVNCKDEILARVRALAEKYEVELVEIEGIVDEGLIVSSQDADVAAKYLAEKGVDAVFVPHANFGQEEAVAKLCKKLGKPVLLWGPRDAAPLGVRDQGMDRPYDTQCGLFATGKALLAYGVEFTYIENCWMDSPVLDEGFDMFIRAVCAAKAFKGARIGQLSVRPWQFLSVRANENELLEQFGIEIVPVESSEIIAAISEVLEKEEEAVAQQVAAWASEINIAAMSDDHMRKQAAAVIAIRRIAEKHGCSAFGGECWSMLQNAFGIQACFVWGALTDMGMPVTCETDVMGAAGSLLLLGAARGDTIPFFADITIRHPENENGELLWHCGPFPSSLAKEPEKRELFGCKGQWEIKGGDITLVRLGCNRGKYTMLVDEVRGIEGPKTNGTYVWVETNDWPKRERKFVCGPYIHHVSGVHGKYKEIIREALKYIGNLEIDEID